MIYLGAGAMIFLVRNEVYSIETCCPRTYVTSTTLAIDWRGISGHTYGEMLAITERKWSASSLIAWDTRLQLSRLLFARVLMKLLINVFRSCAIATKKCTKFSVQFHRNLTTVTFKRLKSPFSWRIEIQDYIWLLLKELNFLETSGKSTMRLSRILEIDKESWYTTQNKSNALTWLPVAHEIKFDLLKTPLSQFGITIDYIPGVEMCGQNLLTGSTSNMFSVKLPLNLSICIIILKLVDNWQFQHNGTLCLSRSSHYDIGWRVPVQLWNRILNQF